MKIKVMATLRSPDLTADIGDIINVDEKMGNLFINAGAAELIVEVVETEAVEAEPEPLETEKPIKKGAFKK
jgi:hypothetical protein